MYRWMDPVHGPVQLRFVVPAFIEICNKTQQDRTGFGKRVPPLCKAASVRLSLQGFCFEAVSVRLPLQGFCFEAVSKRLPSPGGVFGPNTVSKEPEYLLLASPSGSSCTTTEIESPFCELPPGLGDVSVFVSLGR